MPDFLLFTTSDHLANRDVLLSRMLQTIDDFSARHRKVSLKMYLLIQRETSASTSRRFPKWVSLYQIEQQVSLSRARNFLIGKARENGDIAPNTICAFPDDDSWYTENFLGSVKQLFDENRGVGFWFCRYSSIPIVINRLDSFSPTLQQTISHASSNTMFIRGSTFAKLEGFDEGLGVGTAISGGEDTEFAIRAFYSAPVSRFSNLALVGHRDSNKRLRAKYFPGALIAISHHQRSFDARVAFLRKIFIGIAEVAGGRLSPRTYCQAVISSFGSISAKRSCSGNS